MTLLQSANPSYRVMVVDDSAVIRELITRMIETDPEMGVVSSVGNGEMAVSALRRSQVDVVVLDIEMPVMDGLTAIPKLLAVDPNVRIVMASTLTLKGAEVSLKALQAGAADYVSKPSSIRESGALDAFKSDLLGKIRALGSAARRTQGRGVHPAPEQAKGHGTYSDSRISTPLARPPAKASKPCATKPMPSPFNADIIAIGSSTGGPQALFEVLSHLKGVRQPILITQHMPATFTKILAEHISRQCGLNCAEAQDGEPLVAGRVYLAPGEFHMLLAQRGSGPVLTLSKDPPENFCRPAVDPMMRSIVKIFNRKILSVILTGMGSDGLKGCTEVTAAGGVVVAQDEQSSVVWGMPGAVANAGICNAILPLKEIGPFIRRSAMAGSAISGS